MTDTDKDTKITVEFAPGCFDEFEGTQEQLDEMIAEIQRMADSGELFEDARELSFDEIEELAEEDELYQVVLDKIVEPGDKKRRLH